MSWDLVRAAQDGDRSALDQFCRRYYNVVFGLLVHLSRDGILAADLTQETFLRALRGLNKVTPMGPDPMGWLSTIARRIYFDHIKSSRVRLEGKWPRALNGTPEDIEDIQSNDFGQVLWLHHGSSAEDVYLDRERAAQINAAITTLSPDHRRCLTMRYFEDRCFADIGAALGRSDQAAKQLIIRARRSVAKQLEAA